MTNSLPWQTKANTNPSSLSAFADVKDLSATAKKAQTQSVDVALVPTTVTTKRYSFDDNGGGYRGL